MDNGRFAQGAGPLEPARNDRAQQLFRAIAARIDVRFANPCTKVATLASELGMTPRHLQRVLHSASGLTFGQYLRRRRVAEASRLLLAEGMSLRIKEVAARVGLNDTRTLDRHFSREIGLTPGRFRARHLAPRQPAEEPESDRADAIDPRTD